jgi:para-nitrobenzyl esterase
MAKIVHDALAMGRTRLALLGLSLAACGGATVVAPADSATAVDAAMTDAPARADAPAASDAGCVTAVPTDPLVARTELGLLRGAMSEESLAWLGVPFAEPPTGARRWRPPVDPTQCWGAVREATTWAPRCPQIPQQQTANGNWWPFSNTSGMPPARAIPVQPARY